MSSLPSTAGDVVTADLDTLCHDTLREELEEMAGRHVLVTGAAGFLGHYLVQCLTHFNETADPARRISISAFDNLSRGAPSWLEGLIDEGALRFVQHDMRAPLPPELPELDYVIHAASIASPRFYRMDPIGTMDANINGLRNLLDLAVAQDGRGHPLSGFLFFSSSEIYGDPDAANIPTREDFRGIVSCTGPRACYDESKRFGETLCVAFAQQHGVPVRMARPFNNYGPGMKITDGRLIADLARDILSGRDVTMLSDGAPTRTFCYVGDSVQGYYKILVRGRAGEAYNIGTEVPEISVAELGELMIRLGRDLFGYEGRLIRGTSSDDQYLVDNPNRRCPVIDKARTELGYEPGVPLEEGLRRSLIWYREHLVAEDS